MKFWVTSDYPTDKHFDEDKDVSFLMWCLKGSKDTDIVYNIGVLKADGTLVTEENDDTNSVKTYYTAWGYEGDPWEGRQKGQNLLPTN